MAECVTLGSHNMKEFPSNLDLPVEISGESLNLGHEGQEHNDPNYTEERFRVDRRKLEQMIRTSGNGHSETAEDFFLKIMEETNTQITWPSKLKIGAKSKKDPHIKVAGKRYDVADAKEKVMAVLDTKSTRVTLKMDVSHTEHSHVIGKAGNNIKRVMEETGCHIHFPDSNRNNQAEKSNQVSIAGQPFGVEQARVKIRELLPLVFMFELPVTGLLQSIPDASSPIVQQIQQSYDVSVTFKQRPRSYATTVIIRGSVNNANSIKQATAVLIEHLTGTVGINGLASVTVSMQLEIAPQHHLFIIGRAGANIKQIMQRTGATIHFPDPNNVQPHRKGTVYVTGSMDSVFLARQQLIGYLPLVLMFDMKEDTDIDQGHISQLMEQLDVFISVKPKQKQPSKSVIVKSVERNAANLYEARRRLLGSHQNGSCLIRSFASTPEVSVGPSSVIDPNEASFNLANLAGLLGQSLLNINTNPPMMVNGARSPLSGPQSPCSTAPPPLISTHQGLRNPLMVLGPSAAYNLQGVHQQYNMYTQPNGINKEFAQESIFLKQHTTQPERVTVSVASLQSSSESAQSSPTSSTSPLDLLSSSPATPNPITNPLSSAIAYSAMAAAANQETELTGVHHVRSSNSLMDMLPKKGSPCNSTADLFSCRHSLTPPSANQNSSLLTGSPGPPPESPILQQESMSLKDGICSIAFQNSDHRPSESNCDADNCSDNRAPGHNRPLMSPSCLYSNNSFFAAFDYEQKKQLATKAMQKKPDGESRTPTDVWAGLGFSKSMPDSAIREKLKLHNVRYNGPSMTTTYEALNGEVDRDPWKDSVEGGPDTITSGDYMSLVSNNHMDNSTVSRPSDWPPKTELAELFSKLGLDKYNDLFQQEEIDLATFLTMTDQDLKDLGISTFGARRKMLLAIGDLYKRKTAMSTGHSGASNPFRDSSASSGIIGSRRHDIASHSGRW